MNPTNTAPVLHPLLASSIDPTKFSATITGFLTGVSGLVMLVVTLYHFPLTLGQYNAFVQEVAAAIAAGATAWGAFYTLFGLLRKAANAIFPPKTVTPIATS